MTNIDRACDWYTCGEARFPVYFPEGMADCRHCPFCRYLEDFRVYRCRLTDDYIERQDLDGRHRRCPIVFDETPF